MNHERMTLSIRGKKHCSMYFNVLMYSNEEKILVFCFFFKLISIRTKAVIALMQMRSVEDV